MDPILGRDHEIRQMIDVLTRRRKNNPMMVGEAGVGKTAVVEGFALRVAEGDVPTSLRNVRVLNLDMGLLQAGAGVKGEFENRLKNVIQEVKASSVATILFIDEAHTLIGAGGAQGTGDAANLLKPPLARGELRTIGATTFGEYKKYIEKDPALERRFQPIIVGPSIENGVTMLRASRRSSRSPRRACARQRRRSRRQTLGPLHLGPPASRQGRRRSRHRLRARFDRAEREARFARRPRAATRESRPRDAGDRQGPGDRAHR
jgi:hypothetical protein